MPGMRIGEFIHTCAHGKQCVCFIEGAHLEEGDAQWAGKDLFEKAVRGVPSLDAVELVGQGGEVDALDGKVLEHQDLVCGDDNCPQGRKKKHIDVVAEACAPWHVAAPASPRAACS